MVVPADRAGRCYWGVSVDPVLSVLPVSPHVSLEVEGTIVVHGNRGMLPSSTSVRLTVLPALPGTLTRTRE